MNIIIVILISTFSLIFLSTLQYKAVFFTETIVSIEKSYKKTYILKTVLNYSIYLIKAKKIDLKFAKEFTTSLNIEKDNISFKIKLSNNNNILILEAIVDSIGEINSEIKILKNNSFKILSYSYVIS